MRAIQKISKGAATLYLLLFFTTSAVAQDVPMVTGGEGSPISMLDDLTSSLLADDQVISNGTDVTSSLLDDLTTNPSSSGDPISTDTDPGDPSNIDPAAPVDGGLSLLLAAGAAYGARRLRRGVREKKSKGS